VRRPHLRSALAYPILSYPSVSACSCGTSTQVRRPRARAYALLSCCTSTALMASFLDYVAVDDRSHSCLPVAPLAQAACACPARRTAHRPAQPPLSHIHKLLPARARADMWGTCALLACLAAGSAYQQAPLRASAPAKGAAAPLLEEEKPALSPLKLAEEGVAKPLAISASPARSNSVPRNGHKEAMS